LAELQRLADARGVIPQSTKDSAVARREFREFGYPFEIHI
jgi:hypothetical protein